MTRTPPRRVEVWGAAKVNIGWRVGDKRADGYHEVCGLLHTISLTDRLEIVITEEADRLLTVEVPGHSDLEDESNLIFRAAAVLAERAEARPTVIRLHKAIPVAAGLGGGSADAAAALVGLNTVWGAGCTAKQLVKLAAEIGSDVPGILLGGLVHVGGRGEDVRSVGAATNGWFVLGIGDEQVSAGQAYETFDDLPRPDEPPLLHHNDLEPAACALVAGLRPRLDAMRRASGVAFVSGSGPTVIGVASDEAHARDIAARVRNSFSEVVVVQPIDWGVRVSVKAGSRN